MKKVINTLLFVILIFVSYISSAQNETLQIELKKAETLRTTYRFTKAITIYNSVLKATTDTVLRAEIARKITLCENGAQMLRFAFRPHVLKKDTIPVKNFFLSYDLHLSGFWALTPPELLSKSDTSAIAPFLFTASDQPDVLYFAAHDPNGNTGWDIYETHRLPNNEWSTPERLSETINSPFDERFPYVTPDGKTLYFSSTGHYGMGGFDLYKSTRATATGEWSMPENLGFPFSSAHDDMLYVPDADGLYACFVSTRDAPKGHVSIYKIALEGTPIKRAITEIPDILQLETLNPTPQVTATEPASPTENGANIQYNALRKKVKQTNDRIAEAQRALDQLRADYAATQQPQEQKTIAIKIELREQTIAQYYAEIGKLNEEIGKLEYNMLAQGLTPTTNSTPSPTDSMPLSPTQQASFAPNAARMITLPVLVVQQPIITVSEEKDFTFRTHTSTEIFYDEPIADISYRIQIGIYSRKLPGEEFKGFSPVFGVTQNGKWAYAIGSFPTFNEAQKQLPAVKHSFKDALIVAFKDGKTIPVKQARTEEGRTVVKKPATHSVSESAYQIVLGEYPSGLPQNLLKTVQQATGKDITKSTLHGKTVYAVGPYTRKSEAESVLEVLHRTGFTKTQIEEIEKK